jgi:uncharacterized membrane protein
MILLSVLKTLHFLALMFGSAASLGNIYLMLAKGPHDLAAPGFTNMLRKLYRLSALGAIGLFWITGVALFLWEYGFQSPGTAFTLKILLVILLSAIVVFVNLMAPSWARRGGPPDYLSAVHWIAALLLIANVVLAGFAFG